MHMEKTFMITNFCVFCGNATLNELENHHVIPKVKGGTDDIKNLLTVCCNCHGNLHDVSRPNHLRDLSKIGRAYWKGKLRTKTKKSKAFLITKDSIQFCMREDIIDIAEYLNISKGTFYNILCINNRINNKTKISTELKEKAIELRKQYPKNLVKICEILNISRRTLSKILDGTHVPVLANSLKIEVIF